MSMEDPDYHPADMFDYKLHTKYLCKRDCEDEAIPDFPPIASGNNDLQSKILTFGLDDLAFNLINNKSVQEVNKKGETALHLVWYFKISNSVTFLEKLLEMGANVNTRNIWGQTALHYASFCSLENIRRLVSVNGIDVNIQDTNGINALHCLISSRRANVPIKEAIDILIKAGTAINTQTKYGNSILHLAAEREDKTLLLEYIVSNFSDMNLYLKNQFGDNFLHIYTGKEKVEKIMDLLSHLEHLKGVSCLKQLLNDRNGMGRSPWNVMIDSGAINKEAIKTVIGYGIAVPIQDSLGNSVLHRIARVATKIKTIDVLEVLLKGFNDINTKNIFGEPAGSTLFPKEVFDVFSKYGMNLNIKDRWGRDSLVSIMKHHPEPGLIRAVITEGKVDVNSRDMYWSTPLHFAAYHNFPELVELLLELGGDISLKDKLGDTPLQTCIRHCSYKCLHIIETRCKQHEEITYLRERGLYDVLQHKPNQIISSQITSSQDVQKLLGLPEDSESFFISLLNKYHTKPPQHLKEINKIKSSVNNLGKGLCKQMKKYDSIFDLTVYPTGSMSEGTKVGPPDEFDFVVSFDEIVDLTEVVLTKRCVESNFVCLKFKETPVGERCLAFSDRDGFFLAFPVLQNFFRYLKQALQEADLWSEGNLYYNFEDNVSIVDGKPVFNFDVYWVGLVYKQLKISVDIVPGVYINSFWPPTIDSGLYHLDGNIKADYGIPLMTWDIIDHGCFLIFQTKNLDFEKRRFAANDNISATCNEEDNTKDYPQRRMLRVSAAPAEICLMKSMPEKFRQAYALAKIVKRKYVCPDIMIDVLPTSTSKWQEMFKNKKVRWPVKPNYRIKSYMLKNCLFYIYQEMSAKKENLDCVTVSQITKKMYHYLLYLADERLFRPYFLPYCDIFEEEKPRKKFKGFIVLCKRELSIKLVLGILNHPFPKTCLADIKTEPDY